MRRVVSERFPFVEVEWEVRGQHGSALAFLDTGFNGFLILPADWLGQFGAPDALDRRAALLSSRKKNLARQETRPPKS